MAKLLEKKRQQEKITDGGKSLACLEFTDMMEKIVNNEKEHTGYLNKIYPINCYEFSTFHQKVNNNTSNKIKIHYNSKNISYITTIIDTKKDMVTYQLKECNNYDSTNFGQCQENYLNW